MLDTFLPCPDITAFSCPFWVVVVVLVVVVAMVVVFWAHFKASFEHTYVGCLTELSGHKREFKL